MNSRRLIHPSRKGALGYRRQPGRNRRADCWIEPQRPAASLSRVPNGDNLLRLRDRLALGLGTLRLGRSLGGGALAILCSAVSGPLSFMS
jgi:hypothetical protein